MIQALMLVSLGFFAATLLALLIAPAAWARAVRLTSHRIRQSLPINETEIRAEKDQLRASHAVVVHQLEKKIDRAEMSAARQRVELNRRDAQISDLEDERVKLQASLDENRNARHVLSQTLNERLPRAEERLRETRDLLKARDTQVAKFVKAATEQHVALAEASAVIRQQEENVRRLEAAMMARQDASRNRVPTEALEQTMALQSEVRELRERTASQSKLIERIQEAERTQMQDAEAAAVARAINGTTASDADSESRPSAETPAEPKGFAARFNRWRAALDREKETTSRLRAELANAHDRAAKLSQHYREELRGLSRNGAVTPVPPDTVYETYGARVPQRTEGQTSLLARTDAATGLPRGEEPAETGVNGAADDAPANGNASETQTSSPKSRPDTRRDKPTGKSLADRLGATPDPMEDKSSDDTPDVAPSIAGQRAGKSGTLLQRLKGMEDG